jgi:hypothetical protein
MLKILKTLKIKKFRFKILKINKFKKFKILKIKMNNRISEDLYNYFWIHSIKNFDFLGMSDTKQQLYTLYI